MKYLSFLSCLILLLCGVPAAGGAAPAKAAVRAAGKEQGHPAVRLKLLPAGKHRWHGQRPFGHTDPVVVLDNTRTGAGEPPFRPCAQGTPGIHQQGPGYPAAFTINNGIAAPQLAAIHDITRLFLFPAHLFW